MNPRFTDDLPPHIGDDPPQEFLNKIAAALHHILRKREIWFSPPAYLGYAEFTTWENTEAMDVLAKDAYGYAVLERWEKLQSRRCDGDDINPLIYRNLQQFIHDRHSKNNRTRTAIYANVRLGISHAVRQNVCRLGGAAEGPRRVRSRDEVMFVGYPDADSATKELLREILIRVFEYRSLVIDLSVRNAPSQRLLAEGLAKFPVHQMLCFEVRALAKILQNDAQEWGVGDQIPIDDPDGDRAFGLPGVDPDHGNINWREMLETLDRLSGLIDTSPHPDSTRERMRKILMVYVRALEQKEEIPGVAQIGAQLGLATTVVWENKNRLGVLLERLL